LFFTGTAEKSSNSSLINAKLADMEDLKAENEKLISV